MSERLHARLDELRSELATGQAELDKVERQLAGSVVDVDVRRRQMPALCPRRIPKAIAPSIC